MSLISLHEDIKRIYEELRLRKTVTENTICEMLSFAEIARWRKEEMEIGRDKHLIHETVKSILPKVGKNRIVSLVGMLIYHQKGLLFER